MRANEADLTHAGDPNADIASCALDPIQLREQRDRYRQLADAVTAVQREPERITVQFDTRLDCDLLERTLAVERECCPFYVFRFDHGSLHLEITVRQADELPALEAMADMFFAERAPTPDMSSGQALHREARPTSSDARGPGRTW